MEKRIITSNVLIQQRLKLTFRRSQERPRSTIFTGKYYRKKQQEDVVSVETGTWKYLTNRSHVALRLLRLLGSRS